jgi:hypothetical protein
MTDSYVHLVENMIRAEKMFRTGAQNPTYGFVQSLGYREIVFLTSIGLLNNGRCPICGAHSDTRYRWTGRNDSRREFDICKGCMHTRGGGSGVGDGMPAGSNASSSMSHIVGNVQNKPSNSGGCASVFILLVVSALTLIGGLGYVLYQCIV